MRIKLTKTKFRILLFTFAFCLLPSLLFAQTKAVWVRPFIGVDEVVRRDAAKGREFIRRELEQIKRADLNTVYLETFWDGYTIFPLLAAQRRRGSDWQRRSKSFVASG